ncbi:T3SS effector HopA1 family protein [Knoellia subterranea]|uniref:Uncharacterized protein n=1 Tax=Knoellia subterranea KCTC 19937 TaxID=1385521 RepID=A0A0A0JKK6_9MICO|nr:T3SS effector HopA1 family protein [Knoellia subterranea]KGN37304.1 hypothetical protein N803_15375 [Knoellia subterranea KCTC 19937]
MKTFSAEHARELLAARDVLREPSDGTSPSERLYQHWYAVRPPSARPSRPWDPPIASLARVAHAAASAWGEEDVEVIATGIAGVVVVHTATGRRALTRGEYVTTSGRPGFPPREGDRVRVIERRGAVVQDGWWRTWGAGWDQRRPPADTIRVYLRPAQGRVAELIRTVTSALAHHDSWLVKVASRPELLDRPDAVVAYVAGPNRHAARAAVADAVLAAGLSIGDPPPLTCRLGEGVGWADDPGTGESFGEVRCQAIATAYAAVEGHAQATTDADWLDAVAREFASRGIDPAQPHRTTGKDLVAS